ncbi:unnamed protein product [Rotaria socialis]
MASIRLKVQVGDSKSNNNSYRQSVPPPPPLKFVFHFVISPSNTIADLIYLLERHITEKYSYKNVKIIQLMTDDGYLLSNDDSCLGLLKDNDRLICYDMNKFIEDNYLTLDLENLWLEIKQHDASDNFEKSIQVGLNNLGKLFIRIYGTSTIRGLYMFSIYELIKIANRKEQNNSIARLNDKNWFIEAKWEYDSISEASLFLLCNFKIGSNEHIWSNKLHLLLDEPRMCIERGEIICLSDQKTQDDNLSDQQLEHLKELTSKIQLTKRIGPEIDIDRDRNKTITKHDCEGDSLVRMAYGSTNTVTSYQDLRVSDDGTFLQHFVITHINFSKKLTDASDVLLQEHLASTDKPISVVKLTVFYHADNGSWYECEDIDIAPITLRNQEPMWLADSLINIEPDKLVSFVIKGYLRVKGKPGRDNATRKRIHKNLSQPFQLKIVITDNFHKQCSLIVEQLNKPLEYDTSESFVKYNQSSINNLLAFVYADDCNDDERVFMAIYIDKEHQLVIKSGHSYSITLGRKNIRTMEFEAKQNQTTEVSFDSIYYQYDKQEKKATALFDSEYFIFYAIRLEISTSTSTTEETVLLPLETIK